MTDIPWLFVDSVITIITLLFLIRAQAQIRFWKEIDARNRDIIAHWKGAVEVYEKAVAQQQKLTEDLLLYVRSMHAQILKLEVPRDDWPPK